MVPDLEIDICGTHQLIKIKLQLYLFFLFTNYAPFEEVGFYCFANVGRSVGRSVYPSLPPSVGRPNGDRSLC